ANYLHRLAAAVTRRGRIEANRIVNADCNAVLPTLPSDSVDLVLTDPPYGVRYRDRHGRTVANDGSLRNVVRSFRHVYRVLKPDRFCVCFYGWNRVDEFFRAWTDAGFYPVGHLVWQKGYAASERFLQARHEQAYLLVKGSPAFPARTLPDVQPWVYSGNKRHPTEKAVAILRPLIESFSEPGDIVLDPFVGSGSTAVAAALCGRQYLGIELEARYCACARRRLAAVEEH